MLSKLPAFFLRQKALQLFLTAILLLSATAAQAAPPVQYSQGCSDCHGMPPLDSPFRNLTTGSFKGNHQTHASSVQGSCAKCHSRSAAYSYGHMTSIVYLSANINSSPAVGQYKVGGTAVTFFNHTSMPVLGSCSNVNCHFETVSPTWGTSQFSSPADCNKCHTAAPNDGNHPVSGQKHGTYYGTTTSSCSKCHPDHTADNGGATPFAHATSAGNRGLVIQFTAAPNSGGSYSGTVTYPNYLPSQSPSRNGNCTGLYCHSPGNKSSSYDAPNQTATWGGTLTCLGCHKSDYSSGTTMTSGSHSKHVNGTYSRYKCYKCHAATATSSMTIATYGNHVDKLVNIAFAGATTATNGTYGGSPSPMTKAPGSAVGTCTNVYCHSTVQPNGGTGTPTYKVTPSWGTVSYLCGQCHPDGSSHFGAGTMSSGSHTKHLSYAFQTTSASAKCAICHNVGNATFAPGVSCTTMSCHQNWGVSIKHADHNVDVSIVAYFGGTYTGTPVPGDSYGTCTDTYCHSQGTSTTPSSDPPNIVPTWGGSLGTTCTGCHKGDSTSGNAMSSGSHGMHTSFFTYSCSVCHIATVSSNRVISTSTNHNNRLVNISFGLFSNMTIATTGKYNGSPTPMTKIPGSAVGSCENILCHSTVQPVNGVGKPNAYGTPTWGTTLYCNGCHRTGPGVHTSTYWTAADGSTAVINTGSHEKHLSIMGQNERTCARCHKWDSAYSYASCSACHSSNARQVKHGNGLVNMGFDSYLGNGSTTYSGTPKPGDGFGTCSNSYCHSNGTSIASGSIQANTSASWGAGTLACNSCHGNTTYGSDFRRGTPLYSDGSPKGNAHDRHTYVRSLSGSVHMTCNDCHASTTRDATSIFVQANHVNQTYTLATAYTYGSYSTYFRDGDDTMDSAKITFNYTFNSSGSSCSNVSCHSIGLGKTRSTSTVKWNSKYLCSDCHNIDMESTTSYHHAMRNYSTGYPATSPNNDANSGTSSDYATSRRCTMCHVDHNIFSPDLNSSTTLKRGGNLRTGISDSVTSSSGYTNNDYLGTSSGGICISCHNQAKTKDTTRRRVETSATATPPITLANYSGSKHQYDVPAQFMSDGSVVYGNCSKCHNALLGETSVFMNATSDYRFGNHASDIRRLQGSLDAAGGESAEEQICYRCHSLISDSDPGGGPAKSVADKDFYGVAAMNAGSQNIFTVNKPFSNYSSRVSTTNKLFFKPNGDTDKLGVSYPSSPMPDAGTNDGDLGNTFATSIANAYIIRSMSPWDSVTAYETKSQSTNEDETAYWRMVKFVSPTIASTTTVPAGTWVINMYARESSTYQNARIRYRVYRWTSGDAKGTDIIADSSQAITSPTELSITRAPGYNIQIPVNLSSVTLNSGEKIVVDLALETTATSSSTYTAYFFYGNGAPSNLTLPGNVGFNYKQPPVPGYGHSVTQTAGIHRPSPTDETLTYLGSNKHVECVDCHNPHATRFGNHSTPTVAKSNRGSVLANVLKGALGIRISYSGASSNWSQPAQASYSSLQPVVREYQLCFKCHSNAINTAGSWFRAMTSTTLGSYKWNDLGLEFNPNNQAYHPVIQALPSSGNRQLASGALTGGWQPGSIMTCSDCHGRDTGSSPAAQGPHGSAVKWLLTGTYQNWPYASAANNGSNSTTGLMVGTGSTTVPNSGVCFCFNCHTWSGGGGAHIKSSGGHGKTCVACHIRVPHGGKVPRLLTGTNAPARYKPDGKGGGTISVTGATRPASGTMYKSNVDCTTTCTGHGATSALTW